MASYINPNSFWQLSFIGFAFPVVLLINVFFLLFWLTLRKRFAFIPLIAILLCWKFILSTFAIHKPSEANEQGIKLMTWNVKNFDLYNWSHNMETRRRMMDLIRKENPDILCMQEFYNNNQLFHNLNYIRDSLGYKYSYFHPAVELYKLTKFKTPKNGWQDGLLDQQWGVVTFSKFPITDTGRIAFNGGLANECVFTDININGKPVRLYNVHFQSIHLGYDDYATLDSLQGPAQTNWSSIKKIMRKMKLAYSKRSWQANAVKASMDEYKGAKILCGDFNDVPVSYTYKTVIGDLQDAFVEKGRGFGATFANKLSIFRIDYTLFDPDITIHSYKSIHRELSDHYPVIVTFSL